MTSAAFFRAEGTLVSQSAIATAAWMAANGYGLSPRLARLGNVALAAPLALAGELASGATATRMTWMGLRGMSEDRLAVLAEEYFEELLEPSIKELGRELLNKARAEGRRIILISDSIEQVARHLADHLGVDDLICNRLELRKGKASGRLEDPVVGGNVAGQFARAFAEEEGIDLALSWAYGAQGSDALLLSAIGQPCAVDPDWQLRRLARDHHWPVLEAR
ncbi:MAG: HAD-IB family phosphatase [Myxococcales bacterium]|nr:HAD-IB family phosphatase [Myxococcales bacterium]